MTEIVSNVYDLIYPSPATLKELSCHSLVTGLWRWEVRNHTNNDFEEFISRLDIHRNLDPNIPTPVRRIINEYTNRFISSTGQWSAYHHENVFSDRSDITSILFNFCDFVCDRDGSIHYARTARKMMMCDRLSDDEKFRIACMYCFEDDIRRIWPSVSEKLDLNEIEFDHSPELFYWFCMLRNEPNRIPNPGDDLIDDLMLQSCLSQHWSSVEYFWNRICAENRLFEAINLSRDDKESFVRFMLPKLSDQLLDSFVRERGTDLIYALVTNSHDKFYALPTWIYIRNKMNEDNFTDLMELFMHDETHYHIAEDALNENSVELGGWSSTEEETLLSCEIWSNSPDEWKRSAVRNILTQDHLFIRDSIRPAEYREIRFLLTLLLDASFKDRNDFWKTNWRDLIVDTRGKDLHRIMKLCFKDENDIAEFKETIMSDYERISACCIRVLGLGYFEQVNDILIFCCPDAEKRMDLTQRLLQSCISDESFVLKIRDFSKFELMNDFINDAVDNAEVAADFKNRIISLCSIEDVLYQCIHLGCEYSSDNFTRFVDTFVSNEEVTNSLKQRVLEYVRNRLLEGHIGNISADDLQKILIWCLGNEEEVTVFKKTLLPVNEFFANPIWGQFTPSELTTKGSPVSGFLKWYFRSSEEIEEFYEGFADQSASEM
ncbi:uncharacterized protein LOC135834500 isoform X13 [Planococcus citri]|uniref:uncharacterized protein LOC135834500 isoform X13 n=1 Tax=Planococcus citri TaxID=170843 RepID=UPI0031F783A0